MVEKTGFEPATPRPPAPCSNQTELLFVFIFYGRGNRVRTCDLMLPKHPLYQTELLLDILKHARRST